MKPRVIYWLKQPTPYFVQRCNAIADRGAFDFEAWFNVKRESDRSWDVDESQWRFRARYIPSRSTFGVSHRVPVPELLHARPDVVVQEYDRAYLAAGFCASRRLAGRTAFRVLPNYDEWSDRTWWRETAKHVLFRSVDGAKVPGPDGEALAGRYGLPHSRVWKVRQSIDVSHYSASADVPPQVRKKRRGELGLKGCVFLYVGRLWDGKGVDTLLDAYAEVSRHDDDVSLLIVGDGVDERRYRERARNLSRVTFAGFVQPSELPAMYALADVFVFPTRGDPNGLVVEEALAAGLPVITTDAAGDIERRIPPGGPGFVVPSRDPHALAEKMGGLASDEAMRSDLSRAAVSAPSLVPHEAYAADFEVFVQELLALPARSSRGAHLTGALGRAMVAQVSRSGHEAAAPV